MSNFIRHTGIIIALLFFGQFTAIEAKAEECRWFGTKPFCDGQCPSGWRYTGQRESCTSGSRRYCCRPTPPRETFHQQCFYGQLCIRSYSNGQTIRAELLNMPQRATHVNFRCPAGHQSENRITCQGRWVSAQLCNKGGPFSGSRCDGWVQYTHPLPR